MQIALDQLPQLIFGGLAGVVLMMALANIWNAWDARGQYRAITSTAIANGFLVQVSFSPLGVLASELTFLTESIPASYATGVQSLVAVATVCNILFGWWSFYEHGGYRGFFAFFFGFAGGFFFAVLHWFGPLFCVIAVLLEEWAPEKAWLGTGRL